MLFIAVDDLRPEIRSFGRRYMVTPWLDRLAERGVVFERAYVQQAVCSPSRTSLLTGLRPDSTRVYDLRTHFRNTVPDVVTLPEHFKRNGYHTAGLGKIYHGGLDDPRSWSEPWRGPRRSMYQLEENVKLMARKREEGRKRGLRGRALSRAARGPATEAAEVPDESYPDGELRVMAVETLRRLAAGPKPFFLAVGFLKPHLPFNAPKRYWDLYDREECVPDPGRDPPRGVPECALHNSGELRSYHDIPAQGPVPEETARRLVHGYRACVSFIDRQIGHLLEELERLGIAQRTIVIVWGDHGWHLGDHGLWCKHTNFENATRAALLVSVPGKKARGARSQALVEFVDIYPTLCELAGLALPAHLEGRSFAALLDDPNRPFKDAALSQYPRGGLMGYSVRTERYRYTRWVKRKNPEETVAEELYDYERDPHELVNLAAESGGSATLERLRGVWERAWRLRPAAGARR